MLNCILMVKLHGPNNVYEIPVDQAMLDEWIEELTEMDEGVAKQITNPTDLVAVYIGYELMRGEPIPAMLRSPVVVDKTTTVFVNPATVEHYMVEEVESSS